MALETLKGIEEIGGFKVLQERVKNKDGSIDWTKTDEARKDSPIFVDHDANMISFRIQNGPIKEHGVNGCQVDTLIETAKIIIEKLNEKFPCRENRDAIAYLGSTLGALERRTRSRQKAGVEGTSKNHE